MKRLENYQKPVNNDTHGYDGPIAISNGGQITPVAQDFLRASHAIGVPYSDDIQGTSTFFELNFCSLSDKAPRRPHHLSRR